MGDSRYVGRVGVLAVALGIGTALAAPVAWADDGTPSENASRSSSNASTSPGPRRTSSPQPKPRPSARTSGATAASGSTTRSSTTNTPATSPSKLHRSVLDQKSSNAGLAPSSAEVTLTAAVDPGTMVLAAPKASALLGTVSPRNAPVGSPAEWVMLAAARREVGDPHAPRVGIVDPTTGAPAAVSAVAPAAAKTTLTLDTYNKVINAGQTGVFLRGLVSDSFAFFSDPSWTLEHTSLLEGADLGLFGDEMTLTYTTPYADTFLKEHADALLYAPSDYTAWITAERIDNPGVIVGAERLSLGYAIVAPAVAVAPQRDGTIELSPVREMRYTVVFVPSNVTPIFPGGDITPPTPPTISAPAKASTSVTLAMTGGSDDVGVAGYNVYRLQYPPGYDGTQNVLGVIVPLKVNYQPIAVGATFTDTGLEPLTTYGYTARAVDATGLESLDSTVITVQTPRPDTIPPTPPVIAATKITKTTVTLLASGGTDDVGVVGYEIYRDDSTQSYVLLATVAVGETFVDTVSPDAGYIYFARAFDAAGNESDTSDRLLVETPTTDPPDDGPDVDETPPTAPVIVPSKVTTTTVALTPSGGEDNVGVVSYNIYRDGLLIAFGVATGATITVEDLTPDTPYRFTARAVDAMLNESVDSREVLVETLSEESPGTPRTPGMTEDFDPNLPVYVTNAIRTVVKNVPPNWQQGVADGFEQLYRVLANVPLISNALGVVNAFVHLGDIEIAIKLHDTEKLHDALYGFYWDVLSATPLVGNAVGITEGIWDWGADLFNEEDLGSRLKTSAQNKVIDTIFRSNVSLNILHTVVENVLIPSLREKYGWT